MSTELPRGETMDQYEARRSRERAAGSQPQRGETITTVPADYICTDCKHTITQCRCFDEFAKESMPCR